MNQGVDENDLGSSVTSTYMEPSSDSEAPPDLQRRKDNKAAYLKENPELTKKEVNWVDWREHQGREIISAGHQERPVRQFLPAKEFEQLYTSYKPIKKRIRSPEQPPIVPVTPPPYDPIADLDNFGDDDVVTTVLKPKKFKF